jgi:hypothetical protein
LLYYRSCCKLAKVFAGTEIYEKAALEAFKGYQAYRSSLGDDALEEADYFRNEQALERREAQEHLDEVAGRNKKFWKDGYDPDPTKAIWGAGKTSHPELWDSVVKNIKSKGVKVKYSDRNLTYGPSATAGEPGVLTLTEDASITALLHEAQHFSDDLKMGYPGLRYYMLNPKKWWDFEFSAYMEEINFLRKNKEFGTAEKLVENARLEKLSIQERFNIKL